MCGFLTIYEGAGGLDPAVINLSRDTMSHRGPDDAGTWISPDGRLALAHRRLSILDLSPLGHQPMADPAERYRIVFNGEIYNHTELRRELADNWCFCSHSDTETILAAYSNWGEECLNRLQGMFAFVLYDALEGRLFAARDRAGEKPFFYRVHPGGIEAASELKALMARGSLSRHLDLSALDCYLAFGYLPGDRCILEGVRKLPPAHALSYSLESGAHRIWRYWQLPAPAPLEDPAELLSELESLLESAVRRQLVADVPVGVLLSGGVDSSVVTALAARASGRKVRTFTIAFPGQGIYDESGYARTVASFLGTDHTELAAAPATVDLLPDLARQFDEPMCDSSMVPTYLVSRLIRQHCTVALGGDGADEMFGGYHLYQWALGQVRIRARVPSVARSVAATCAARLLPVGVRGRNYLLGLAGPVENGLASKMTLFDRRDRLRLSPLLNDAGPLAVPTAFKTGLFDAARGLPGAAMAMDFASYLSEDILVKVDRASMLTSLEVRAPFLDHRVVEFAFAKVPNSLRADLGGRKLLLKRLARKLLPPELDVDRKQGFSLPLAKWFAGPWGKFIEEVLAEAPSTLFARSAVESLIEGQKRGRLNGERLFCLAMFELWRREYRIST